MVHVRVWQALIFAIVLRLTLAATAKKVCYWFGREAINMNMLILFIMYKGVRVTVGPKIIEFHHPVTNQLYSSVSFTCKAIGSPAPSIHWYKDNKLINITDPSLLMFNDLSLKDRGVYHCEARSVINGVNVSVNTTKVLLNIEGKSKSRVKSQKLDALFFIDVLQYVAVMSLTDDFYDNLNDSELINGTIQQLVEEINYNLSGRIIGNSNLFFVELLNIQEIE